MESEVTLQKPGELIRPNPLKEEIIVTVVQRLFGLKVLSITELSSYDDRNYHVQVDTHQWDNPHIKTASGDGYVLKILNVRDSQNVDYVEGMNCLLLHLIRGNIQTTYPQQNKHGDYHSLEKFQHGEVEDKCIVRLFTFIPGVILAKVPYDPRLMYQMGSFVGEMDRILMTFHHPFYTTHDTIWNLKNVVQLSSSVGIITDPSDRKIIKEVISLFSEDVLPNLHKFQKYMIHGDTNEQNILVGKSGHNYKVIAILDAGDATLSYLVFEVAILIAYVMIDSLSMDRRDVGGHILAGYLEHVPLSTLERDMLTTCVAARLVQSLVMGQLSYNNQPGNEYLLATAKNGWKCLRELWMCSKEELLQRWDHIIKQYKNNPQFGT